MNLSWRRSRRRAGSTTRCASRCAAPAPPGITVVVAAGNFGKSTDGKEVFGAIGAPGNDPSVITVGAVNIKSTVAQRRRRRDAVQLARPTRGAYVDAAGVRRIDNLIKPDLVARATGHRRSLDHGGWALEPPGPELLQRPRRAVQFGAVLHRDRDGDERHLDRRACGRRRRRAVAAGQPGLTPPLVKAILQYTRAGGGASLAHQGRGPAQHRRRAGAGARHPHRTSPRRSLNGSSGRRRQPAGFRPACCRRAHAQPPGLQLVAHRLRRWQPLCDQRATRC